VKWAILTLQIGQVSIAPAIALNAPINANAPICLLANCGGGSASQGGSGAGANPPTGGAGGGEQSADHSLGTVQVGNAGGSPAVSVNAPVNGNAPVCVASDCAGGDASQGSSSAQAGTQTAAPGSCTQSADHSLLTVQACGADVTPSASANAPVNANAPVCVASDCEGGTSSQESSGAHAQTTSPGSAGGAQSADHSIGTVQVGEVNVAPAAAVNTPMNANAPVTVLGDGADDSAAQPCGEGTAVELGALS
jgi:hypothetical protein